MKYLSVIIICLVAFAGCGQSARKIQLFEDVDFKGLFFEVDPSTINDRKYDCADIPKISQGKLSSINTNGHCVVLYDVTECISGYLDTEHSLRIGPNDFHASDLSVLGYDDKAVSLRLCDESAGEGDEVNVKLYKSADLKDDLVSYSNLCGCTALPSFVDSVGSVDNGGNCVTLFEKPDCTGQSLILLGGKSPGSQDLSTTEFGAAGLGVKSVGVCNPGLYRPSCLKLDVKIFQFGVSFPPLNEEAEATSEMVSIAPKTGYTNRAPHTTITEQYSAATVIHEGVYIDRSALLGSGISKVTVQDDLVGNSEVEGISLLGRHAIQPIFSAAFTDIITSNSSSSAVYFHGVDREVVVNQLVSVEPCTSYAVSSHVAVIHDHPLNYVLTSRISGEYGGNKIPAEGLQDVLKDLGFDYVEDFDDFTVIAKVGGSMKATFSHATSVSGEESRMEDCIPGEDLPTTTKPTPTTGGPTTTDAPPPRTTGVSPTQGTTTEPPLDQNKHHGYAGYYSKAASTMILVLTIMAAVGIFLMVAQLVIIFRTVQRQQSRRISDDIRERRRSGESQPPPYSNLQ